MTGSYPRSREVVAESKSSFSLLEVPSDDSALPSSSRGESLSFFTSTTALSSNPSQRFELWKVPEDYDGACYRLIGQGISFCILSDCSINHKSVKHFHPLPGAIFVLKTSSSVFCEPSIDSTLLSDDIFNKWKLERCSLHEWLRRFRLVELEHRHTSIREPDPKISIADLEAKQEQDRNLRDFKTLAKKRQN